MISGVVAIVGRPNVGKSTLFNLLTRSRDALVDDRPGVTRDRIYGKVEYADSEEDLFWVIDTGGFETDGAYFQPFKDNLVWQQTSQAIDEADLVIMMFDARDGLHPHDRELVQHLRRLNKAVVFVANKIDHIEQQSMISEFYQLGVDEVLPISAAHSRGVGDLREAISELLRNIEGLHGRQHFDDQATTSIALVGRPNVGKSSILNRLTGEDRSVVSEIAGTTRDTVNSTLKYQQHSYLLLDTAGIRKRAKVKDKIEVLSVIKSLKAISEADIVILVVDAVEGFAEQEARLASVAADQYKGLIIVVNKWDLVTDKTANMARDFADAIRGRIKDIGHVPVLFVSCTENQRVHKIFDEVERVRLDYSKRVPTSELNRALTQVISEHTPALTNKHNKRVKFFYATQVSVKPPTIVVKCNLAEEIQESYKRYMVKRFRDILGFGESPVRLLYRGKDQGSEGSYVQ
jgi:GTP-binding protein